MSRQDELRQVGREVDVVLEEPEAQDTTMQVDHPPQPNSEVVMGAVGAAAQERPLRQIPSPTPAGSAHHHGGSAAPSPFEMGQLMAMLAKMNHKMDVSAQRMDDMRGDMDANTRDL